MVTSSCFKRDGLGRYQQVRPNDFAMLIPKYRLREALGSLDVVINSKGEVEDLFFVMDLDDNKGLDEEEFTKALQASSRKLEQPAILFSERACHMIKSCAHMVVSSSASFASKTLNQFGWRLQPPSALGGWVQSLPIASLLLDALPRPKPQNSRNWLRAVSELTAPEVRVVATEFALGLERMLMENLSVLKDSFSALDKKTRESEVSKLNVASKFSISESKEMKCGTIEDFHHGLVGRIGDTFL